MRTSPFDCARARDGDANAATAANASSARREDRDWVGDIEYLRTTFETCSLLRAIGQSLGDRSSFDWLNVAAARAQSFISTRSCTLMNVGARVCEVSRTGTPCKSGPSTEPPVR